jgi:endogenous inhibitor of DNA gyrase (YacG/DUF329 family)
MDTENRPCSMCGKTIRRSPMYVHCFCAAECRVRFLSEGHHLRPRDEQPFPWPEPKKAGRP